MPAVRCVLFLASNRRGLRAFFDERSTLAFMCCGLNGKIWICHTTTYIDTKSANKFPNKQSSRLQTVVADSTSSPSIILQVNTQRWRRSVLVLPGSGEYLVHHLQRPFPVCSDTQSSAPTRPPVLASAPPRRATPVGTHPPHSKHAYNTLPPDAVELEQVSV